MLSHTPWFIRARLKTRQLLLLVALAEEGNMYRAASVLNMTQPAASKLLKDLEDVLEVSLFERQPRGMRPTWYGESLIRHARMVLISLGQAYEEIIAIKTGLFGHVGIGAISTPGLALLPAAISLVKQEHPNLRITVDMESSPELVERLDQGKLDLVIARLGAEHDKSRYRYDRLAQEPICVVVRAGHPLLAQSPLTLQDVAHEGWIVPTMGSVLRHRFDLMYLEANLSPPTNMIETTSVLFMTQMLEKSNMLAIIGSAVGQYYQAHGILDVLPLTVQSKMDAFGIITRRDQLPSPGAVVMMHALRTTCLSTYGVQLEHDWVSTRPEGHDTQTP